jgi:hypothetical protein
MRRIITALATTALLSSGIAGTASAAGAATATADPPAAPAATAAGTIVFLRDGNIWIARADGSGLLQVTRDGTATAPYMSPTMSDAGIIAAGKGNEIVRMDQNGVVLNRMDPPTMLDSAGQPSDGPPVTVAISPDGSKIAWTFAGYNCPIGVSCGARSVTGVTAASTFTGPTMTSYEREPSWVTNSRLMVHGGYGSQVKLQDPTAGSQHWFDDSDLNGDFESTDLGDASLTRDGRRLVAIRGYGATTTMIWYAVSGDPLTGSVASLPTPVSQCHGSPGPNHADPRLHDPSWSPDGSAFAIGATEGIWVVTPTAECVGTTTTLLGPGSEPSWSAAPINPPPVSPPPGTQPPGTPQTFVLKARPKIIGKARVGRRLKATTGTWSPTPTRVRYAWLRNGKKIKKSTRRSYRVTRKDRGARLAVRVVVSRADRVTRAATSKPVRVRPAARRTAARQSGGFPDTRLTTYSWSHTAHLATFNFDSPDDSATFECSLTHPGQAAEWGACRYPTSTQYASLEVDDYLFRVRAVTAAGADPTPASRLFNIGVDTVPPVTSLTTTARTTSRDAVFHLASNEPGTFECRLRVSGKGSWDFAPCTTPVTYSGLGDGTYEFVARAIDAHGEYDVEGARHTWLLDATAPETSFSAGSFDGRDASFGFGTSDGSAQCTLVGPSQAHDWKTCTSPTRYVDLAPGAYEWSVRGEDRHGNVDPTPGSQSFEVRPAPAKVKGPKAVRRGAVARFRLSSPDAGVTYECKLDRGRWKKCRPTHRIRTSRLKATPRGAKHVLRVRTLAGHVVTDTVTRRVFRVVR